MMRKIAIGLAAAAIAMGGSTLSASAAKGGGGGGPRGGGGAMHVSGGGHGYAMGTRGYHGREYGGYRRPYYEQRYHYRYPYRYGSYRTYPSYGGSCWRWNPDEGRRVWVCGYGGGPSYGTYRYGGSYNKWGPGRWPQGGGHYPGGGHGPRR